MNVGEREKQTERVIPQMRMDCVLLVLPLHVVERTALICLRSIYTYIYANPSMFTPYICFIFFI